MKQNFSLIPNEIKAKRQWVLWKLESRNGKKTKLPYQRTNKLASVDDSKTWDSFVNVINTYDSELYKNYFSGIGFVFCNDYVAIDFDHVIVENSIESWVLEWIEKFKSYTEISQSGTGLHILAKGSIPGHKRRKGNIEMYSEKRYFALTGNVFGGYTEIRDCQKEIDELYFSRLEEGENLFNCDSKPVKVQENKGNQNTREEREEDENNFANRAIGLQNIDFGAKEIDSNHIMYDLVLKKLKESKNKDKFLSLWSGDISSYGNDESLADLALCSLIAFYVQDFKAIEEIFCMSGLYREKWNREDYRKRTIQKAISGLLNKYKWSENPMNISELNEKASKMLSKSASSIEEKTKKVYIIEVLEISEKAIKITLEGKQIGLEGVFSAWLPKSKVIDCNIEEKFFEVEKWIFENMAEKAVEYRA
jgi:putative DNA primase/helicase